MIHIVRKNAPSGLRQLARTGRTAAARFFAVPFEQRAQKQFDFDRYVTPDFMRLALGALQVMFRGKCAYCESLTTGSSSIIDSFRPRRGVAEVSGQYLLDHYWAQAYEWENLYLSCVVCNRLKANRFPVSGERAPSHANRESLSKEHPLLLDPCRDHPLKHLVFTEDGQVAGGSDRGFATIEILGLNRPELVKARFEIAERVRLAFEGPGTPVLTELLDRDEPFVALRTSLVNAYRGLKPPELKRKASAIASQIQHDAERETATVDTVEGLEHLRARARYIEHVEIWNIGSITHLTMDLSVSMAETTPCFALLGENGFGKSTILECIAMALAGRAPKGLSSKSFVRQGQKEGRVVLRMSGFKEPVEMVVTTKRADDFKFHPRGSRSPVLAYGSSRLLANARHKAPAPGPSPSKIENLFDPFLPLTNIGEWLARVADSRFDDASCTLQALLPDKRRNLTFVRTKGRKVTISDDEGMDLPFEALSDGFQSMLGLSADILEIMYSQGHEAARAAQAVVLIDELGNHLHPKWRMQIVKSLRTAFPQVQFIFSTHEPLCLKGLKDGEVAVLKRDAEGKVYALENLPSLQNLRVDQLLTSQHFGMDSLVDPEIDTELARYRELCGVYPSKRTEQQTKEWNELVTKLTNLGYLGQGWRERTALRALDEATARFVAETPSVDAQALTKSSVLYLTDLLGAR